MSDARVDIDDTDPAVNDPAVVDSAAIIADVRNPVPADDSVMSVVELDVPPPRLRRFTRIYAFRRAPRFRYGPIYARTRSRRTATARTNTMSALRNRNFAIYAASAAVSNIGSWMQRVAQDWLILSLTHDSATSVGIATALQFLPALLLSPVAGLLADRYDTRSVILVMQGWKFGCSGLLGVLAIAHDAHLLVAYSLILLFGVGTAFDGPLGTRFLSDMLGPDDLANAVGLDASIFHASRLIGPAVGGVTIAAFGAGWAILANAVTFVLFAAGLLAMDTRRLVAQPSTPPAPRQIRNAARYIWRHPQLRLTLAVALCVCAFGMNFQIAAVLMAKVVFARGASEYGLLASFLAAGSLLGAALSARRAAGPPFGSLLILTAVFAVLETLSGLAPTFWTFAIMLPVLGALSMLVLTGTKTCVQLYAEPELRGRVAGFYATAVMGGTPVGAPLLSGLAQLLGPRWVLIGGGLLVLLTLIITVGYLRRGMGADITRLLGVGQRWISARRAGHL